MQKVELSRGENELKKTGFRVNPAGLRLKPDGLTRYFGGRARVVKLVDGINHLIV